MQILRWPDKWAAGLFFQLVEHTPAGGPGTFRPHFLGCCFLIPTSIAFSLPPRPRSEVTLTEEAALALFPLDAYYYLTFAYSYAYSWFVSYLIQLQALCQNTKVLLVHCSLPNISSWHIVDSQLIFVNEG